MTLHIKIILVEPLYQGNVGSVARVIKNFGFNELILVNPCVLEGESRAMSAGASDILNNARTVESISDAIGSANIVIGTTGIKSSKYDEHIRMPYYSPESIREKLKGIDGTIAILFGREDCGLTNEELKLCDMISIIPASIIYPIMNLSHAVCIMLYELSKHDNAIQNEMPLADKFDLELLYEHIYGLMGHIEYPIHKKDKTMLMLKRIFGRAQLLPREVQTLHGIIRKSIRKL
ncbi:MAG: RNA methyltransferase [Methanosarcinaceae archaeon]|nr:RNA methyltransferase [Methanosarcinaceae archaeon]